jgi:hypothetical protein
MIRSVAIEHDAHVTMSDTLACAATDADITGGNNASATTTVAMFAARPTTSLIMASIN